ncbi:MAG: alpha/beta hydrolase [Propionibacteriaceae bacterium]|nr:alpha/beta hydrolase [Propionibacteriaceae bacterium]
MARIEPRDMTHDEFPESTASSPSMRVIEADGTPRYGYPRLGIEYAHRSGRTLRLHIILPPMPDALEGPGDAVFPTIAFVQGSAWREQDLGASLARLAEFGRRGYVIAIVEYRPSDVAPFPAQVEDAAAAVSFLRDHASEYHVDPDNIVMWGDSSGGHTTLMTLVGPDLGLRAFVDYYGPTDIGAMNDEPSIMDHAGPDSPEGMLIGGVDVPGHPDLVAPTVVMNHIPPAATRHLAPLLIVHGSKDRLVPFGQSVLLNDALVAAEQDVTFYQLRGADHGGHAFWAPPVLDLVDAFLRAHLR